MPAANPPPCPVIARVCPWADGRPYSAYLDHEHQIRIDLFLPLDPANPGRIVIWDGCHSEAHVDYYRRTKPPRTPEQKAAAQKAIKRYRAFMAGIPAEYRQTVIERQRLPRYMRQSDD